MRHQNFMKNLLKEKIMDDMVKVLEHILSKANYICNVCVKKNNIGQCSICDNEISRCVIESIPPLISSLSENNSGKIKWKKKN